MEEGKVKRAKLCSELVVVRALRFLSRVLLLCLVFQLCREVISRWQSWCKALAWSWLLILCRLFSASLLLQGHCDMAPVVGIYLGEAGAFPNPHRLEDRWGPRGSGSPDSVPWGLV